MTHKLALLGRLLELLRVVSIEEGTISSQSSTWVRKNVNYTCTVTHWC